jgi:hypothetical protein
MRRQPATIICDAARSRAPQPASSQAGDWHDVTGHHRYYGSSAVNGGERIVEDRRRAARASSISAVSDHSAIECSPALTPLRGRSVHSRTRKRGGMAPAALHLLCSLVQG